MARIADDTILSQDITSTTVTSEVVELGSIFGYAIQLNTSGTTLNGTAELQASLDGETFVTLTGTGVTITASGGTELWNISDAFYTYLRVSITADSNTITAEVLYKGKGV